MKKEKNKKYKKAGFGTGMVIMLVIGMMFGYMAVQPQLQVDERGWHVLFSGNLAQAAEADPGAGASGILEIFIVNHSAAPSDAYNENTSATIEGWCTANGLGYATADDSDVEIAYDTTFDIVVRVRGNTTHCYRTDKFYDTDLNVTITSADLSISADTDCTRVVSSNDTGYDFIYVNFYLNNGGSGYTISKGSTAEIQNIKFAAYY